MKDVNERYWYKKDLNKGSISDTKFESLAASITLLRHLHSMVAMEYRGDDTATTNEEEKQILEYVWADLENPGRNATRQEFLQYLMAKKIPNQGFAMYRFLEPEATRRAVWGKKAFRLYHPVVLIRHKDEAQWQPKELADPKALIVDELVSWNGAGDLGGVISDQFGMFFDARTGVYIRYSFGDPAIIRVRYAHVGTHPPRTYAEVKQIRFDPHRLQEGTENGGKCLVEAAETVVYNLVAVARAGQGRDNDRIHRYGVHGEPIPLPPVEDKRFGGAKWALGDHQPPHPQYLLYYVRAPPGDALGISGAEAAPAMPNVVTNMLTARGAIEPK